MRLLMLAAALALTAVNGVNHSCSAISKCYCQDSLKGDLELICPRPHPRVLHESLFVTTIDPGNMLKFHCPSTMTWTDYNLSGLHVGDYNLSGLHVGPVPRVIFLWCPLPDMTLNQMFQYIGASGIESLTFKNGNLSDILESSFLGLSNLTSLTLQDNGITDLPVDLFRDMTALKYLDMKMNALQIPLHVFDYLSNLLLLELGSNHMTHLEMGIFRNLSHLRRLGLWGNNLQNLTQDVFAGLSGLQVLDIGSNELTSISADLFANMPQLKEVIIPYNNFTSLPDGLFSFTSNLTKLALFNNKQQLQHIPPGLLANLINLLEVYLNGCSMTQVPGNILWGSPAIVNISLNGNLLTTLPVELFRDTVNLENLKLGNNRLQALPDGIFSGLHNLKILEMDHNQLTSISRDLLKDLRQLEWLNLEHNQLQHISEKAFTHLPRLMWLTLSHNHLSLESIQAQEVQSVLNSCLLLEELYVSHNSITTIFSDWITSLVHLRTLDLSHNLISYITVHDMQFLTDYITLDLAYNNISTINLEDLETMVRAQNPQLHQNRLIRLEGNPITCDCKVYDLLRYFQDSLEASNMFKFIPGNLTCAAPPEFRGISMMELSFLTLECPISPLGDCPRSCKCSERPVDFALIVDCSGMNLSESPASLPDPLKLKSEVLWPKRVKLNHTELRLNRNGIVTLPQHTAPGYSRVTKMYLSHNNISTLTAEQMPPLLQVLELDHNNLMQLNAPILQALANKTTGLQYLTLHANPWHCNCLTRDMLSFLQEHFSQVAYLSNVTCGDGSGRSVANLTISELCPVSSSTIVAASVIIALLGIMVGVSAALYYYFQNEVKVWLYARGLCLWFITEEELDKEKLYDAFISYSHHEEEFVVNQLVPELEGGMTPFKLCLHYRDWIAGEWIPNQIARSVEDSRRTLVVLSPSFLESVWGRMEFRTAHSQALSEGRARVIVLLYGDIGPLDQLDPELRAYLSMNTYVKWGDPWFWDKLRYALPHPQKLGERRGMELKTCREAKDDKLELINPSTPPTATTPPTDTVLNPIESATLITNGHTTLLAETNGHVNNCFVKSI